MFTFRGLRPINIYKTIELSTVGLSHQIIKLLIGKLGHIIVAFSSMDLKLISDSRW